MRKYKPKNNYKQLFEPLLSIAEATNEDLEHLDISQIFNIKKNKNIMKKTDFKTEVTPTATTYFVNCKSDWQFTKIRHNSKKYSISPARHPESGVAACIYISAKESFKARSERKPRSESISANVENPLSFILAIFLNSLR